MKHTVTVPPRPDAGSDVFLLAEWRKEIGEAVAVGETLAVLRAGANPDAGVVEVPSPAYGLLSRKVVLPGEAVEAGEPLAVLAVLAVLAGVPDSLVTGEEAAPDIFAARPPYVPGGPEEIVPLSPMARAVAEHMARSHQASPHVYTFATADVGEALRLAERAGTGGDPLPFVAAAVAGALTRWPDLNAQLADDGATLRRKRYVHLGLAVRDDAGELTVAVLRDADRRSVAALGREAAELLAHARAGTLPPDARRGATFTLWADALPAAGVRAQTPLLPQPHTATLRLGAVERMAAVVGDAIQIRPVLHLCLAHDARAVPDGAAAGFLADVTAELGEARFLFGG